jgi:hypothetical protein
MHTIGGNKYKDQEKRKSNKKEIHQKEGKYMYL